MKKVALLLVLLAVVGLGAAQSAASPCWNERACNGVFPCVIGLWHDAFEDDGFPGGRNYTVYCGTDCNQLLWTSGAQGCVDNLELVQSGSQRYLCGNPDPLIGPGCCVVPCKPPAIGCEPDAEPDPID